jgi:HlyD family secretion protein
VFWRTFTGDETGVASYLFTEVVRTDLRSTVSSTGTLSTVEAVEVGTQVSGQVLKVLVDFNDLVEEGQLLALIDTEALDAALKNAQARVVQAEAQEAQADAQVGEAETNLVDARATMERNAPLAESGYLSQSEIQPIQTALQNAEANLRRTQAVLRSAQAQVEQPRPR